MQNENTNVVFGQRKRLLYLSILRNIYLELMYFGLMSQDKMNIYIYIFALIINLYKFMTYLFVRTIS